MDVLQLVEGIELLLQAEVAILALLELAQVARDDISVLRGLIELVVGGFSLLPNEILELFGASRSNVAVELTVHVLEHGHYVNSYSSCS